MAKSTQVELAQIGTELDAAELAKSKYTKSIGSIDPTAKATQDVTQLYTLQGELLDAKKEQAGAVALQNYYNGQMKILDPSIVPNLAFQTNPRIDADKQQLATLEQQRIVMSAQYTPSDSQMIANQSQIDAIKSQMAAERKQESSNFAFKLPGSGQQVTAPAESYVVTSGTQELNPLREDARAKLSEQQATIDADQVEVKTLSSALGSLQSDVHTTPDSIMNMTDLTANIDVYRTIYSDLQGQNAQLEARLPAEQSYAKFLQQPLPPKKMLSPQPALYTIAGAIFGLFIGCILALVVDSGDVRMRDAKDAEMLFGRPLLQSFAGTKRLEQSVSVGDDPEPYHELACTLGYLGVGRTLRSILLTSAVKDEGSAQIASNLAIALSKEGRRVVLIDANVRKPILHVLFGQENNEGLAGLMRNGAKPDHALVEIAGSSTLSIIPGGESGESDDPRDMLNAEKFAFILNSLREQADIVLIDAPAVFAGYETSVIADKVDGIIFVSRSKFTSRATARKAFDLLSNCQAPIIGTVLAGTKE
jgi:capsular exopolysaccharide synthesis family protein